MTDRFEGTEGRRRLVTALQEQRIVRDEEVVATAIADTCQVRQYKVNDILTTQGSEEADIFFILSGSVAVVVNGRGITERGTGYHVGEMALIDPTARRSATLRATEDTDVAVMAEADFTRLATKYPHLWRRLALDLAHRLRERNKHVIRPNHHPEVFVGSSAECLEVARQIQSGLERDAVVTLWTDGVFELSSTVVEDLLAQVARSDFAVLVVSGEDAVTSRNETSPAPRDNVIFELGLFMGELGRSRSFIVKERGSRVRIPSDLLGVNAVEYHTGNDNTLPSRIGPVCSAIRHRIRELGPK